MLRFYKILLPLVAGIVLGVLMAGLDPAVFEIIAKVAANADIELIKILTNVGGVVAVALIMMFFQFSLARQYGGAFVNAIVKVSESMASQAACISEVKDCVKDMTAHGINEHKEMLLGQKIMADELKRLTEAVEELRK